MAHIKPGVITNNFMEKNDYLFEIKRGTLYYETWEGGLLLLRRRQGFSRMNYYLTGSDVFPELPEGEVLMTEPVFRSGDDGKEVSRFLNNLGFETLFQRARFMREAESGDAASSGGSCGAEKAGPEDAESIYELLTSCFSAETGCLPERDQIPKLIEEGRLIRAGDDSGETAGVLHFKQAKKNWEIRHLAVSEKMRGRGLACGMAGLCFRLNEGKTGLVWARQDYAPAMDFYRNAGYRPDGWTSAVMRRGAERP